MPNKKAKQKKYNKARAAKENKQRKSDQKRMQRNVRLRMEYAEKFIKENELWAEYTSFIPPELNLK